MNSKDAFLPDRKGAPSESMGSRLLRPFTVMAFFAAVLGVLALLFWGSAPAMAQEAISQEEPTPSSVDEMDTPMKRSFEEKPPSPGLFPWLKEKLKDTPAFFRDTKLDFKFRTHYFEQDNTGAGTKEAWAIGG